MSYPSEYLYHKEHAWLLMQDHDEALIGISFFAQDTLGDVVEIGGLTVGSTITQDAPCGTVESRKTVSDLIAPASGVIIHLNENLMTEPFLVNDDPYKRGWIARIRLTNKAEVTHLMNADEYQKSING